MTTETFVLLTKEELEVLIVTLDSSMWELDADSRERLRREKLLIYLENQLSKWSDK